MSSMKGPQSFSTTGPWCMQQIVANMTRGDRHDFLAFDDGTYVCYGGHVGKREHFSIGDEVVVMEVGHGVAAKENLTQFEKVKVVGVEPRGRNQVLLPVEDTPRVLPEEWYLCTHHDLIVQKENGTIVPMVYWFEVSTINDYRRYWREVNGWDHFGPNWELQGRCPSY